MTVLTNAFALALKELSRNLGRAGLTALGITIGVMAVIAMVGLGRGATAAIESDLSGIGANLLIVQPGTGRGPRAHTQANPFRLSDVAAVETGVAGVRAVAPTVNASAQAVHLGQSWQTAVTGSTNGWLEVLDRTVAMGRAFTDGELRSGATVCLLGETVRQELFGDQDPVGRTVRLDAVPCTIVGVLAPKGANTMGMDEDDFVLAPIAMVQRRLVGSPDVGSILVSARSAADMDKAAVGLDLLLRKRRGIPDGGTEDFMVLDTREMAAMLTSVTGVLTMFLAAVAGVSLLVGGIGIMNIMLVSVTERTREIGIRLAIGALERDVMAQFLVEAGVLASLGGVAGVVLGVLATWAGAALIDVPVVVDPLAVVGAVVFSALVGVGFGWIPARRAARMAPVEALRHS